MLSAASSSAFGYVVTALLFFAAWLFPRFGPGEKLIAWVSFEKLCLMEFLSCHAITLLAGAALVTQTEGDSEDLKHMFWGLIGFYFILGTATYFFHRDHSALIGFYAILVTRGFVMLSLQTADADMMRAELLKNLVMFVPMMFLVAAISIGDGAMGPSWRETFVADSLGLIQKISKGWPLLLVTAYYLLWALVGWKWPLRIASNVS
jgi:hypothetical protein